MSATVEQLASQIQVLLDDAYKRGRYVGFQDGLQTAADAVNELLPDLPPMDGEVPVDDAPTTIQQAVVE